MAKLSETFTYKKGGDSTAPSLNIPQLNQQTSAKPKLSETFSYDTVVPHNEPKIVPVATPSVNEAKAQVRSDKPLVGQDFSWKNVLGGLSNYALTNTTPTLPTLGNTSLTNQAATQAKKNQYQQDLRNKELADFDAKDTSAVVFTGKNGNKVTRDKLNLWLQSDYKLSADEKKQIKELVNETTNVKNYKKYFGNMNIEDAAKIQQDISRLEQRTKGALGYGVAEAIPGFKATENLAASIIDSVNGNTNASDTLRADREAASNTTAYKVGRAGSKMGQYVALNASGVLKPVADKLGSVLIPRLGETIGTHLANILADEVADVVLDTAPEMIDNISEGKSAKDVTEDVIKNLGVNLAYNIGGEAFSELLKALKRSDVKQVIEEASQEASTIVKNGPTEIEKEAEALRRARTVEPVPVIEPTELEKEAEALRKARTAELVPSAIEKMEVPTAVKEMPEEVPTIEKTGEAKPKEIPTAKESLEVKPDVKELPEVAAPKEYIDYTIQTVHRKGGKEAYVPMGKVSDNASEALHKAVKTKEEAQQIIEDYKKNLVMAEDAGLEDEISELVAPIEITAEAPKIPDGAELPTLEPEVGPVSQFWKGGTMETVTNPETYKNAYEPMTDINRYVQKPDDYAQMVSDARLLTNGQIDAGKVEDWRKALSLAENISKEDMATAMDIKAYYEANNMLEESADFMSRIRPHITNDAQVMQYLGSLKKNSLEGSVEQALGNVRKEVDKHKGKGFSDAINNFANQVEDAIKSGDTTNVANMFKKKVSDYAYGGTAKNRLKNKNIEGEQMVLDLIGGWEPNKKTVKELAEEVGSAIRKLNGVADITSKDEAEVLNLLRQASEYEVDTRAFKELQAKAAKIIDNKIPVSVLDKVKTTLYDNMLGNFKTAVSRNFGGNVVANTLEKAQKPLKVAIDKLVGKITGERNYILDKDVAKSYGEGFGKGFKDQALDFKTGINTTRSGEETFKDALGNVKTAYKGKNAVSKALGEYDRIVKGAMQFGDRPFYEAEFAAAKTELNKIVDKFGKDSLTKLVPDEALGDVDATIEFLARERALEACFQKGTLSAEGFKQLKEGLGNVSRGLVGADVISQFSMPFIQVPANMMERMADYIPGLGTAKNIATTISENKVGGGFNQRRFVDATARNLTGLGLFGGGVALANNAAKGGAGITSGYSDDYDKAAAEKAAGEQEYAIKLPNGYQIDISDLPVLGPTAQASARFAEALRNNEGDLGKGIAEGSSQALSSAFETSALQGLNRMFGTTQYGEGGLGENVKSVLGSGLGQAVPSLLRQATQVIDPNTRYLGEPNTLPYFLNSAVNATPARIPALQAKVDNEGNVIEQNQGRGIGSKILENMVLPWKVTKPEYSKLGEVANSIYENSSDHSAVAYPTVPSRNDVRGWLGDKYTDNAYYDVKKRAGKLNSMIGNDVVKADFFKNLSADEQALVMKEVYTGIKAIVREENEKGYTANNGLADAYKLGKFKGVVDYLSDKYTLKGFKNDAMNLNPNGSATSMDKKELAVQLYRLGYSLDDINTWVVKNGAKKGFTESELNKLLKEAEDW